MALILNGGVLDDEQVAGLRLVDGELREFEFATADQARERLSSRLWRRLAAALDALATGSALYLVDGRPA